MSNEVVLKNHGHQTILRPAARAARVEIPQPPNFPRRSRRAAVRWPGASSPRASELAVSVPFARGGAARLSVRSISPTRIAGTGAAYHDERVANSHHRREICPEVSCRAERLLEEPDQPGCVVNHEPRGHAMPTLRDRFRHWCSLESYGDADRAARRTDHR